MAVCLDHAGVPFPFSEEILTLVPAGLSPTIHVLDQIKVIDRFRGRVKTFMEGLNDHLHR